MPTLATVSAIVIWCGGDPGRWTTFHQAMVEARRQQQRVAPWTLSDRGYPVPVESTVPESDESLSQLVPMAETLGGLGDDFGVTASFGGARLTARDVARHVIRARRVAIVGRAGSGKTVFMVRALHILRGTRAVAVVAIRPDWTTAIGGRLLALDFDGPRRDWRLGLDILLEAAVSDVSAERFEILAADHSVILVIDSVNSASSALARRVIEVVDSTLRYLPNVAVVVTDRNADRYPDGGRWQVAEVCEVEPDIAAAIIDARFGPGWWAKLNDPARRLLASPFFLNLSTHGSDPSCSSRAAALRAFFSNRVMLTDEMIDAVTLATIAAYRAGSRRLASSALPSDMLAALVEAGVLSRDPQDPSVFTFSHELFGDYLASRELVASEMWQPIDLDLLTFSTGRWRVEGLSAGVSNFDVVTLAGQQLPDAEAGLRFVSAIYDWNWRVAVDCLATTDPVDGPFSRSVRAAVLGLLCERMNDPVDGTRRRARRLLSQLPDPEAHAIADLPGPIARTHLLERFADVATSGWFADWCGVFGRTGPDGWDFATTRALFDANTLLGWTVSHVLRRHPIPAEVSQWLVGAYDAFSIDRGEVLDPRPPVRWRAVHALGAADGDETLSCLLRAFDHDSFPWVRWEAARSTTMFAAHTDDVLSARAIDCLHDRIARMSEGVALEIAWVAQYHGASPAFSARMRPLIVALADAATDEAARVRWRGRVRQFDDFWSAAAG